VITEPAQMIEETNYDDHRIPEPGATLIPSESPYAPRCLLPPLPIPAERGGGAGWRWRLPTNGCVASFESHTGTLATHMPEQINVPSVSQGEQQERLGYGRVVSEEV
jgi:hypothetical protein